MPKIKLYGNIAEWTLNGAEAFSDRLMSVSEGADRVSLHVHSYGGSVIEGSVICNAIKNNPVPVDIYVDGIAASMAAIILQSADRRCMAENAFLMIHAPSGGDVGRGTAGDLEKAAKTLKEIEDVFVKTLVSRTGKSEECVQKWMEGDNWFSAKEALNEGLIDEIVNPVIPGVKALSRSEIEASGLQNIYDIYSASLIDNQQNKNKMNKKEFIAKFSLSGVTEESSEADIYAALESKIKAEKDAREAAENQLAEYKKNEISAVLNPVKDKLTAEQLAQFQAIGEKVGIEALRAAVLPYKSKTPFTAMIGNTSGAAGNPAGRQDWTFDTWQEKDPGGLVALSESDYDAFNALYRGKFGKNAPK